MEGPTSLHNRLPQYEISSVGNGYSVMKISDVIRHVFSTTTPPFPFLPFTDSIHAKTPRGEELLNFEKEGTFGPPTYPIKIILWSDGFKPILFNDNALHCLLATVGTVEGDHRGRSTFPIWLGPDKHSPEFAEQTVVEELNYLSDGLLPDGSPFMVYHRN